MQIVFGDPILALPDSSNSVHTVPRCGFLRRWWHGRLRRADVQMMLGVFRAHARRLRRDDSWQELCWSAWHHFTRDRGQEHWHCACGAAKRLDRTAVCVESIRALAKRVA